MGRKREDASRRPDLLVGTEQALMLFLVKEEIMFELPSDLVELGIKRIEEFPVEGFVVGRGPINPVLMLIGEAPGENEAIKGIPFIGRAGEELKKSLASISLTRSDVYMTSAVRSRPFVWKEKNSRSGETVLKKYNRRPSNGEILAHAPVLDYELRNISPMVIVTLGNVGLQRLIGQRAKISDLHGTPLYTPVLHLKSLDSQEYIWSDEKYTIIPTLHPASVFYRPSNRAIVEEDWNKIGQFIQSIKF